MVNLQYETEYYEPNSQPPCRRCQCTGLVRDCPQEFSEEEPYSEVCYDPITPPPIPCCVEKPKKSFWQQLFGEKKCCSCCKKKQDCCCKVKTKRKCKPTGNPTVVCKERVDCKPCPPPRPCSPCLPRRCKPRRPLCTCNPRTCPCSCPRSESYEISQPVCGCQFYFNVENRPRRRFSPGRRRVLSINGQTNTNGPVEVRVDKVNVNEDTKSMRSYALGRVEPYQRRLSKREGRVQHRLSEREDRVQHRLSEREDEVQHRLSEREDSVRDNLATANRYSEEKGRKRPSSISRSMRESGEYKYTDTSNIIAVNDDKIYFTEKKRDSCLPCDKKRQSSVDRSTSGKLPKDKSSTNDFHIGVTFTKEETKYFKANDCCPKTETHNICDSKDQRLKGPTDSSDTVFTVEIHSDGVKSVKNSGMDSINNERRESEERRRSKLSVFEEYVQQEGPKSESFYREILPQLRRNRERASRRIEFDEIDIGEDKVEETPKFRPSVACSLKSQRCSIKKCNLDKRVSEILRKLEYIEEKINTIGKKEKEKKEIRIDFEGQKSTVSFHFNKSDENNYCGDNDSSNGSKADAVIQVRHTKSRMCSTLRESSAPRIIDLRSSQSLDRCKKKRYSTPKIIIRVKNNRNNDRCMQNNKDYSVQTRNGKQINWCDVSNDLKCIPPNIKCYCYDCVCERNKHIRLQL